MGASILYRDPPKNWKFWPDRSVHNSSFNRVLGYGSGLDREISKNDADCTSQKIICSSDDPFQALFHIFVEDYLRKSSTFLGYSHSIRISPHFRHPPSQLPMEISQFSTPPTWRPPCTPLIRDGLHFISGKPIANSHSGRRQRGLGGGIYGSPTK